MFYLVLRILPPEDGTLPGGLRWLQITRGRERNERFHFHDVRMLARDHGYDVTFPRLKEEGDWPYMARAYLASRQDGAERLSDVRSYPCRNTRGER